MQIGSWVPMTRAGLTTAMLAMLALTACGPDHPTRGNIGAGGGAAATAGAGGVGVPAGTSGSVNAGGGGADGVASPCPEARPLLRPGGTQVQLAFTPILAGHSMVLGEPNPMAGGQVSPINVRFYVSEPVLLAADGNSLAVDLVSAAGQPEPYGVHLVNFEEPESTSLRVLAPPGSYTGARFTLGLNDACNSGGANRNAPLSFNSQMAWPHAAGFLFFRYEAAWTADASAAATAPTPPSMIHMGGVIGSVFAPQATVTGALTVPASGTLTRSIQVSFDDVFRAASSSEDASNVPFQTPEVIAGERLRRAVPTAPIFRLTEP